MSAKLELLHLYCHFSYCLFICYQRATAVTGARFAELITINYLPLRWQSVLLTKKNMCTRKHYLHHALSSIFFIYDTRDLPIIIKYLFFFFNKIFNNKCISFLPPSAITGFGHKHHQRINLCLEDLKQLNGFDVIGTRSYRIFVT